MRHDTVDAFLDRNGIKWNRKKSTNRERVLDCPSCSKEGHLYVNSNGNKRRDGMICMDLDGALKWSTGRKPHFERGGLLLADGLIFNLDGRQGSLHLVEPSPDEYRELASAEVLTKSKGNEMWAPMAISGGKLIVRDHAVMKCLDVRAPAKGAN